ncbi:MAG TPA: DegT/DnrJ/EryC1/StrS family aminotransferase [Rhodospirillales bacterium]|nr:DegT/DnrJ/EryC1/StrS family aminotransferase [Rhodospirillales bacterium]HIO38707.1 DegT/DnrJ/EryC1/StrS family aminotransferase [Rhodospirillales bacterium]
MTDIPWWKPETGSKELALIKDVLESNVLNDAAVTTELENRLGQLLGCQYAVAVTSGTMALFLALAALKIGRGDEVIVPDATFIATANAVKLTGAKPVFVDVELDRLTIDVVCVAKAINDKTKAIIPVHVSGRAANMIELEKIALDAGIFIVEDAAESFMSKYNGRYLGTIGNLGCFSFSPMKLITTGQGGLVTTNDGELHQRLRQLKDQGRPLRGTGGDDPHPTIGYNFKLTNVQAAIGLGQLESLEDRMAHMRHLYELYSYGLGSISQVQLIEFDLKNGELPLWLDVLADQRNELEAYLRTKGIDCRKFWHPIHTQPCYLEGDDRFPNCMRSLPKALWLPSALSLTDENVSKVCSEIKFFYDDILA